MASQMIWFFSYVSLGLALTLGNRPGVHNQRGQFRSRYDHRLKSIDRPMSNSATATSIGRKESTSEYDSSYRYSQEPELYDLPLDWIVYDDENTGDSPDDELENSRDGGNDVLFDQFTSAVLDTLDPQRHILFNNRRKFFDHENGDSLNKHTIRQRLQPRNNKKLSRSIDRNDNYDLATIENHYYDLNDKLNDRRNVLASASPKSSSSLWPIDDLNYPSRMETRDDTRSPRSSTTKRSRTFGKRNQVTTGRRRPIDPRSSTSTSMSQQQQLHQQAGGQPPPSLGPGIPSPGISSGVASQFMLRAARGNRQYDVPQIECPPSEDGMERFACPTPDRMGRYRCIDDHVLCNGFFDCPLGEDEDRQSCMFYKTTKAHLDVLAEALLRWVRAR